MRLLSVMRPVVRTARRVPGYRAVRRRFLRVVRSSATGRDVVLRAYPDLMDREQHRAELAQTREVAEAAATRERRRARAEEKRLRSQFEDKHKQDRRAWEEQQEEALTAQRLQGEKEHQQGVVAERRRWDKERRQKDRAAKRAVPAVSAGILVAGLSLADRPLMLLDIRGMDELHAAELVDLVATDQLVECGFRPLFVTDLNDPAVLRRYGHAVEILPGPGEWSGKVAYEDYVGDRLETIRREYDARWHLTVPPSGLTGEQRAHLRRFGR